MENEEWPSGTRDLSFSPQLLIILIIKNKKSASNWTYFSTPPPSATLRITFVTASNFFADEYRFRVFEILTHPLMNSRLETHRQMNTQRLHFYDVFANFRPLKKHFNITFNILTFSIRSTVISALQWEWCNMWELS